MPTPIISFPKNDRSWLELSKSSDIILVMAFVKRWRNVGATKILTHSSDIFLSGKTKVIIAYIT